MTGLAKGTRKIGGIVLTGPMEGLFERKVGGMLLTGFAEGIREVGGIVLAG